MSPSRTESASEPREARSRVVTRTPPAYTERDVGRVPYDRLGNRATLGLLRSAGATMAPATAPTHDHGTCASCAAGTGAPCAECAGRATGPSRREREATR